MTQIRLTVTEVRTQRNDRHMRITQLLPRIARRRTIRTAVLSKLSGIGGRNFVTTTSTASTRSMLNTTSAIRPRAAPTTHPSPHTPPPRHARPHSHSSPCPRDRPSDPRHEDPHADRDRSAPAGPSRRHAPDTPTTVNTVNPRISTRSTTSQHRRRPHDTTRGITTPICRIGHLPDRRCRVPDFVPQRRGTRSVQRTGTIDFPRARASLRSPPCTRRCMTGRAAPRCSGTTTSRSRGAPPRRAHRRQGRRHPGRRSAPPAGRRAGLDSAHRRLPGGRRRARGRRGRRRVRVGQRRGRRWATARTPRSSAFPPTRCSGPRRTRHRAGRGVPIEFGTATTACSSSAASAPARRCSSRPARAASGWPRSSSRRRPGATVLATASSDERLERLHRVRHGPRHQLRRRRRAGGGACGSPTDAGVDLVVDPVGGRTLEGSIAALAYRGPDQLGRPRRARGPPAGGVADHAEERVDHGRVPRRGR